MLHRITARQTSPLGMNAHLSVSPAFLDRMLADLRKDGYAFLSLDELLASAMKRRPKKAIAITADDGWLDNLTEGLPVFEAYDAPFTVYVAPGLTSGMVAPWWELIEDYVLDRDMIRIGNEGGAEDLPCRDRRGKVRAAMRLAHWLTHEVAEEDQQQELRRIGALPCNAASRQRFMDWDQVRLLSGHRLATIGAHTVHHYNLRRLSPDAARNEMVRSADLIEHNIGTRPRHFAYPYGSAQAADDREFALARDVGFSSAVTTRHGVLRGDVASRVHRLPRISINGLYQQLPYVRALLSGLTTPPSRLKQKDRDAR